jgi:diaminopimelate epimerase
MIDVSKIEVTNTHTFLNTGSPHHINFYDNISDIDVKELGSKIRYGAPYFEEGTNVNFVEQLSENTFKIRTYERGVENETLACGTGVTAVAIAANKIKRTITETVNIEAIGGQLEVSFHKEGEKYTNIFLKGPAQFIFEGNITI